jgi:hypothetical protein
MRNVKLAWNPNPVEENVSEYRLYKVDVGSRTLLGTTSDTSIIVQADTGWVIGVTAFRFLESRMSDTVVVLPPMTPKPWVIASVSSETPEHRASNLLDGSFASFWLSGASQNYPHSFEIDFQEFKNVAGIVYTPKQDHNKTGFIKDFQFFVSVDGQNWGEPYSGSFSLAANSSYNQQHTFIIGTPKVGRYLKFVALSPLNPADTYASMAQFEIVEVALPDAPAAPTGLKVIEIPQ